MDLLLVRLVLLLHFPPWATALGCKSDAARPIALPLRDVLVDLGISDSYMRGIPAKVGTPPQDIAMLPWAELNNTWIYDGQHSCSAELNLTDTACRVRRGSYFRPGDSQTFLKMADIVAAGGAAKEITTKGTELDVGSLVSTSLGGTDLLTVGDGDGGPVSTGTTATRPCIPLAWGPTPPSSSTWSKPGRFPHVCGRSSGAALGDPTRWTDPSSSVATTGRR